MPIELHIQTKCGRCDDSSEPSTAWKVDLDDLSIRELSQFYIYLKHATRYIEEIIDDDIKELDNTNLEEE